MYGVFFVFFYLAFLLWQTYYAIAHRRATRPGARGRRRPCRRSRPRDAAQAERWRGTVTLLLLPLSLLPLYFAVPRLQGGVRQPDPGAERHALPAPQVAVSSEASSRAGETVAALSRAPSRCSPTTASTRRNDVLLGHATAQFAEQMEMLDRAGFAAISIEQYVRFLHGDRRGPAQAPVLITFDDGRLDSYRGADKVLAAHGFRATMFVITGDIEEDNHFYLDWEELKRMMKSGRWDMQEHAGTATQRPLRRRGRTRARPTPTGSTREGEGLESFAEFKRRVRHDILWAKRTMTDQLPGFKPLELRGAVRQLRPDGDTNDSASRSSCSASCARHFDAVFMTRPPVYTTPKSTRSRLRPDRGALRHEHRHALPLAAGPDARATRAAGTADDTPVAVSPGGQVQHAADRLELLAERQPVLGAGLKARAVTARAWRSCRPASRFSRATIES